MSTDSKLPIARDDGAGLRGDRSVLLLIDHQVGPLWELESRAVRLAAVRLASAATFLRVPIIVTASECDLRGPVITELLSASRTRRPIERECVNAWGHSAVRHAVEATGRSQLIVAGLHVEHAVALTAVAAAGDGYDVTIALDSCGCLSQEGVSMALPWLRTSGVRIADTDPVINELRSEARSIVRSMRSVGNSVS